LFSGVLRTVLDPFGEFSDEKLWQALEMVEMRKTVEALTLQLQSPVGEGGQGFSIGQRQLMCFARALLHEAKVLLLDEATASVDVETDQLIQRMLRGEKFRDCTIITIAHRINTIIDSDRILVMHQGRVVEFDTPSALLDMPNGYFKSMVDDMHRSSASTSNDDVQVKEEVP
jgi:ABC-type multidrug transport system fused ATPase/permease subunit